MISWQQAIKEYRHHVERGEYIRADAIRLLIIHNLAPGEHAAYKLIKQQEGISTADLGRALGLSNQRAWDLTMRLRNLDLVASRQPKGNIHRWHVTYKLPQTEG